MSPFSRFFVAALAAVAVWSAIRHLREGQPDPSAWIEREKSAFTRATVENKLVLLDFTGSDWCGYCIAMEREVFSTPEFQVYAQNHLIMMTVDFPRRMALDPATAQQNEAMRARYQVKGFPTLIVLDADGHVVKKLVGYQPGGPGAFVAQLAKLPG